MRQLMLKMGLASQGSIGLVLTRAWKCQQAPPFLLMMGVLVDQFGIWVVGGGADGAATTRDGGKMQKIH